MTLSFRSVFFTRTLHGWGVVGALLLLLPLAAPVWAEKLTLNLKGADILTLVETVSEVTGKNFILDPKVQGKVTVVSTHPMDADELYQTFLSILQVHGFVAVASDHVIKIMPDDNLKNQGTMASPSSEKVPDDALVIQVFPIEHVNAANLIPTLRPLISPKGHLAPHTDGNMLVVSDYANIVARLGKIIQRVDQPITGDIEMVVLKHASAHELAQLLNALEKGASFSRPGQTAGKALAVDDPRTNSLLIGGDASVRLRLRTIIAHLDTPVVVSGNTRVVQLRFAKAEELAEVLTSMGENYIKKNKEAKPTEGSIVNVQVYKDSNALVLTAPATLLKTMEDVIQRLDVRRAQVQVEAIIAEIKSDLLAKLGIEWGVLGGAVDGRQGIIGGTNLSSGDGLFALGGALATDNQADSARVASNMTGLLVGGTNLKNLAVLLRAIKSDTNNNVLSTPSLVTLDNEEAEIVVGKEVPFVTGSFSSTGTGGSINSVGSPFQTIDRKNVGLTLRVTPQINAGDTIHLALVQEASTLETAVSDVTPGMMTTNTRSIKTTVLVDNGQILVLGGLIENKTGQSTFKVPLLGDIPWLGALFRAETKTDYKTNLMVFLRPTILRTPQDSMALTQRKYGAIRDQQLAMPESWNPVFWGGDAPILPDFSQAEKAAQKIYLSDPQPAKTVPVEVGSSPDVAVGVSSSSPVYQEEEDYGH